MYNRTSIRRHRSFKPFRGGQFNKPKSFSSSSRGNYRKVAKLTVDPNLFIRKAKPVYVEAPTESSFERFNLAPILKQNITNHSYINPTPIQSQAINPILEGRDVIGLAGTGTGKTAAFLIPLINKMFSAKNQKTLIIAPTRELALQINQEFKSFAQNMQLYSVLVTGGLGIKRQIYEMQRNPNTVIATPGRLKDLVDRRVINLANYSNIVLDEVDLMVDIGFISEIKFFISMMPPRRQSLFFSATIPARINPVLQSFVQDPVTISVKKQDTSENVDQDVVKVMHPSKKVDQLHDLLIQDGFDKVLVFGKTKHGIEKLHRDLTLRGFKAGAIHGNKRQGQRQKTLESFKRNDIKILLATDVASRGLDIDDVTHVINFDLPETYEDYIHRIGRTGRANKKGTALTFI